MKTIAYVDGFNLYFGSIKKTPYKWLNIAALLEHILPTAQLEEIKYFTAKVKARPQDAAQPLRQQMYLRALQTIPHLKIYYGYFLSHEVDMPLAKQEAGDRRMARVLKTEEKGSDVNLASQLIHDAHMKRFEQAVVISGDSDLLMSIEIVTKELNLPVGVINPQKRPSRVLEKSATFYRHIRTSALRQSQFPDVLEDEQGEFRKPDKW